MAAKQQTKNQEPKRVQLGMVDPMIKKRVNAKASMFDGNIGDFLDHFLDVALNDVPDSQLFGQSRSQTR